MFELSSLLLGLTSGLVLLGFAVVLGGNPKRLARVELRLSWLVFTSLGVQIALFSSLGDALPGHLQRPLHLLTYGLLLIFAIANARILPLLPVLVGIGLNAVAIAANGGEMPVSARAAAAAGLELDARTNGSTGAEHLRFLGDMFALPSQLPFANVFSVGDLLIAFGIVSFIVVCSLGSDGERPFSALRLLEPLKTAGYGRLAAGRLISSAGDWLTLAALVGWIYHSTGSTSNVAVLLLVRLAPPILGGSVAALVVDRLPKTRLLASIELARGVAVALALASVVGDQRMGVYVALACSGALAAVSNAAVPALLPSLLPAERLPSANAGLGLAKDGAMALGAVGAGVALSWFGAASALAVDLGTFAAAFLLYSGLPAIRPLAPREGGPRLGGGLRYMLGRRALVVLVLSFGAATLATGLANVSLPRFLEGEVGFGAGGYGFGIAALAAGLALGQAFVGFTRVGPTAGRWIGIGLLLMSALFVLLGLSDHAPTVLLMIGLIGFVDGTTDVLFETAVQREADPRHLGAVFGFASAFITMTMMSAVAVAPVANDIFEPHGVIIGTSVFLVGAGLIALLGMGKVKPAVEGPETWPKTLPTIVVRSGEDLSIVTSRSLMVDAVSAADALDDISIEIVAAPSLDRWDPKVVLASVEKTSKVLVLHDNSGNELLAAELAATIGEACFHHLDAPVRRVAVPDGALAARVRDLADF